VTEVIKDITENFVYDLSVVEGVGQNYQLNAEAYDVAFNDMPFFLGSSDETPYRRESAQSKREQIDQTTEPGEQSFTGWWFRSQSSWHLGAGAKFFEPVQDENLRFRFNTSRGVDVWTRGQVSLLKDTLEALTSSNKTLIVGANDGTNDCLVAADGDTLNKITVNGDTGTVTTYSLVTGHTGDDFQSLTTDGSRYFAACDEVIHRGNIGGSTSDDSIYGLPSSATAVVRYVKQRLFAGIDNILYELNPNIAGTGDHTGNALPTGHYTHPNNQWIWSDISESGSAIYAAGYAGNNSAIFKITVNPDDATLNPAIVTAELPIGEKVLALYQYLGYMMIGTSKGMRVAVVNADTGDLSYGPLIFEVPEGVRGFTAKDRFVWATAGPNAKTGLYRIDLSEQVSPLRFAYAADLQADSTATTLDVSLLGDRLAFSTEDDGIYLEKELDLVPNGTLQTGFIRYATLESKYFKFLKLRGTSSQIGTVVSSIDSNNAKTFLYAVNKPLINLDLGIPRPTGGQEYIAFEFQLNRNPDLTTSDVMTGYQVKALPGLTKQTLIQYPLYCYDVEMDRYNNLVGSEDDRAYERIIKLESIERTGDAVTVQDFRTNETFQALIEEVRFMSMTPPNARFDGFGGRLTVTVRKL
jgi:hypothetical protein